MRMRKWGSGPMGRVRRREGRAREEGVAVVVMRDGQGRLRAGMRRRNDAGRCVGAPGWRCRGGGGSRRPVVDTRTASWLRGCGVCAAGTDAEVCTGAWGGGGRCEGMG